MQIVGPDGQPLYLNTQTGVCGSVVAIIVHLFKLSQLERPAALDPVCDDAYVIASHSPQAPEKPRQPKAKKTPAQPLEPANIPSMPVDVVPSTTDAPTAQAPADPSLSAVTGITMVIPARLTSPSLVPHHSLLPKSKRSVI